MGDLVQTRKYPTKPWKVCEHMPLSIGCEYYRAVANSTRRPGHYDVLERIVRKRLPPPTAPFVAVHLRLGDTLDKAPYSHWCRQVQEKGCMYAYPISFFARLQLPPIPLVVFTSLKKGMRGANSPNSAAYLENVTRVLRPQLVRTQSSTDEDLLLMMRSSVLVAHKHGGQFATVLRTLAPRFNTSVLPR